MITASDFPVTRRGGLKIALELRTRSVATSERRSTGATSPSVFVLFRAGGDSSKARTRKRSGGRDEPRKTMNVAGQVGERGRQPRIRHGTGFFPTARRCS